MKTKLNKPLLVRVCVLLSGWSRAVGGAAGAAGVSCYYLLAPGGGGYILTIQHSINPDLPLVELLTSDQNEASLVNIESLILHNYIEMLPHTLSASKQTYVLYCNQYCQFPKMIICYSLRIIAPLNLSGLLVTNPP